MDDHKYVNFSEDYELNYHLELVGKSQSIKNRDYLRDHTQRTAKGAIGRTVITHKEFHPFVVADKPYLDDPR